MPGALYTFSIKEGKSKNLNVKYIIKDNNILKQLSPLMSMSEEEGTWMTIKDIQKAGSTLRYSSIYNKIKYSGQFESRKLKGRQLEVLVTLENISQFKIRNVLDFKDRKPLERNTSEVLVHTASGDYAISAKEEYGLNYFSEVMRGILPKSANSKTIEELFDITARQEGLSKKINGSRLIGLVLTSKDAEFLDDDLFTYLSGEAGINIDEVGQALQRAAEGCIKKLSPNLPYIPRKDIPEVARAIRREIYGVDDWPEEVDFKKSEKIVQESTAKQEAAEKVTAKPEPANRFFIEVPEILGRAKIYFETPGNPLHVKEVRTKQGGIEVLVDSEETSEPAEKSKKNEIILTAPELSEITRLHIATIRTKLEKYKAELHVTRRSTLGRPYEARITPQNYHLAGIKEEKARQLFQSEGQIEENPKPTSTVQKPAFRKEAFQEQPVVIDISGKSEEIILSKIYNPEEIRKILKQVHAGIFTDVTVTNVLSALKAESGLEGKKFVEYIGHVNGIMDLSSTGTQLKLEQIGITVEDLKTDISLSRYLRTAPGLREPYIVRADISEIQKAVPERKSLRRYTSDSERREEAERRDAFNNWIERLKEKGIMPREDTLERLVNLGVLVTNTKASIESTFPVFEKEMEGFLYVNLNKIRMGIPGEPSWQEFHEKYAPKLTEKGIIKNIVEACGGRKGSSFYVIKRGIYVEDALSALDTAPVTVDPATTNPQ